MIAMVRGEVAVRRPDHVVVLAAGVGYRLAVSAHTLARVPAAGNEALLHAHLVLRDDGMHLFGFASEEERELFHMLTGVQSVGPKVALAVLSGGPPRELLAAVAAGDTARLQSVPGIGKRTAERIVVELRDRAADLMGAGASLGVTMGVPADPQSEATVALQQLGYKPAEAQRMVKEAAAAGDDTAMIIRKALKSALR